MKLWQMEIRQCDDQGCGYFGAKRGKRQHEGIDLCCSPGEAILSPVTGKVTKVGWPYGDPDKNHIRYVEITNGDFRYRVFYVNPTVNVGQKVHTDTIIGFSQKLGDFYPGITEHVHFEVKNKYNKRIDPTLTYETMRAQL